MSSFVWAGVRSVAGKITRSGLLTRSSRSPASTKVSSLRATASRMACGSNRLEALAGHPQDGGVAVVLARGNREDGFGHPGGLERDRPAPAAVGRSRRLADRSALDELHRGQRDEADA